MVVLYQWTLGKGSLNLVKVLFLYARKCVRSTYYVWTLCPLKFLSCNHNSQGDWGPWEILTYYTLERVQGNDWWSSKWALGRYGIYWLLDLRFLSPRTVKNQFLLFISHLTCSNSLYRKPQSLGILAQQLTLMAFKYYSSELGKFVALSCSEFNLVLFPTCRCTHAYMHKHVHLHIYLNMYLHTYADKLKLKKKDYHMWVSSS